MGKTARIILGVIGIAVSAAIYLAFALGGVASDGGEGSRTALGVLSGVIFAASIYVMLKRS